MPKASPITTSFNGGELSPLLEGRVDIAKYQSGCRTLLNFIPTVQGPTKRRGGTRYGGTLTDGDTSRHWLVPFVAGANAAYVLAFRDSEVTIYADDSSADAEALVEIDTLATPYVDAHLTRSDGTFGLSFAQSADVMYIVHNVGGWRKITRTGAATFTIEEPEFNGGPWHESNDDEAITIIASATTGAGITLTGVGNPFTSHGGLAIGQLIRLEEKDLSNIKPWEPGEEVTANVLRRSDGKTYKATTVSQGTTPAGGVTHKYIRTGGVRPTHTKGKAWDGGHTGHIISGGDWYTQGVEWEFQDPGYGVVKLVSITNGNSATADVVTQLPLSLTSVPTWRWERGAWNATDGYPEVVTFFRERLCAAKGIKSWSSVAGDFENFEDKDFGEVLSDSAITVDVLNKQANPVVWIAPSQGLLIGTEGSEFVEREVTTNDPFGPDNVKVDPQSAYGARKVEPLNIGASTFFVQRGGRKLREITYAFENDNFLANDTTALSEHITKGGLVQMAFAAEPDAVIWIVRGDGKLVGLTYNKEQDVLAWHRHDVTGVVESVAVVPAAAQSRDVAWLAVRRTIDGDTVRFIEAISLGHVYGGDKADAFFVDAGVTVVNGPASATVSGLGHLEGQSVAVLADGAVHPNRTVTAGAITLQLAAEVVQVGLPMTSRLESMRIEAGSATGTAQGKKKRIIRGVVRLLESLGVKWGSRVGGTMDELRLRRGSDVMDASPPLYTGDTPQMSFPGDWEQEGRLVVECAQPLPATIVALALDVETTD